MEETQTVLLLNPWTQKRGFESRHSPDPAAADDDDDATDAEEKEIRAAKLSNNDIDCEAFKKGTLEKKLEQVWWLNDVRMIMQK